MSELPSPLVPPLDAEDELLQLLAEVSGKPISSVAEKLKAEQKCLGIHSIESFKQWKLEPHVWSDRLAEFYESDNGELVGYAVWNRRREKLEMREWIGRHLQALESPQTILTVGDGPGFDSLYLALCGHDVIYSEVSSRCIRFAERLFERSDRPVRVINDAMQVEPESVDAILCLDVLEHLPEPTTFVAELAARLKPGGRLIVHAPFFFISWRTPTHLKSNLRYSGDLKAIYQRNGLELVDGRTFWDPLVFVKGDPTKVPQRSAFRLAKLRMTGILLAAARVWNGPHNWLAGRAMQGEQGLPGR